VQLLTRISCKQQEKQVAALNSDKSTHRQGTHSTKVKAKHNHERKKCQMKQRCASTASCGVVLIARLQKVDSLRNDCGRRPPVATGMSDNQIVARADSIGDCDLVRILKDLLVLPRHAHLTFARIHNVHHPGTYIVVRTN
jgi:hypothetical protein